MPAGAEPARGKTIAVRTHQHHRAFCIGNQRAITRCIDIAAHPTKTTFGLFREGNGMRVIADALVAPPQAQASNQPRDHKNGCDRRRQFYRLFNHAALLSALMASSVDLRPEIS